MDAAKGASTGALWVTMGCQAEMTTRKEYDPHLNDRKTRRHEISTRCKAGSDQSLNLIEIASKNSPNRRVFENLPRLEHS